MIINGLEMTGHISRASKKILSYSVKTNPFSCAGHRLQICIFNQILPDIPQGLWELM